MVCSIEVHRSASVAKLLKKHEGPRVPRLAFYFVLALVVCLIFLMARSGDEDHTTNGREILPVLLQPKDSVQQRQRQPKGEEEAQQHKDFSPKGFLVFTSGCKIPDLDPLDPAVRKYVKFYALDSGSHSEEEKDSEAIRPDCSRKFGPALVESNLTSLYLVRSAFEHYNVTNDSDLHCCYRPFHRVMADPEKYKSNCDDLFKYEEKCVPFGEDGSISVDEKEFVRVECRNDSTDDPKAPTIYKDFHSFVSLPIARKRAEEQKRIVFANVTTPPPRREKWNVLILGVDANSRLNFHRQLTKTKAALDEIGAIELLGYTKVGDNTFPNVVAVMTGMPEEELKSMCWPKSDIKLDDCPWLWYNFTANGYLTALGEDASWMSTFNYAKTGFLREPVHLYLRPFAKVAEDENGHLKRMNAKVCVGPRLTVKLIFDYVEKLVTSVQQSPEPTPFFGHFWTNSLTHDYLNSAGYLDDPMSELLGKISASGILKNTVLVLVSDHGIRWGGIRSTYQGRLEERLPFALIALPKSLRDKYPSAVGNLRRNARMRLTTPLDLHATLLDLIDGEEKMTQEAINKRSKELPRSRPKGNGTNGNLPRSMSLFLPIPEWRTCSIAGISASWCCCHENEKSIGTDDPLASAAAGVVVEKVNEMLEVYPQCAKRTFVGVKSAFISSPSDNLLPGDKKKKALQDLSLVVESNPGSALFEATVRMVPAKGGGRGNTTFEMTVVGVISRINRYGNQSVCVDEFHAKLYCYCGSN